MLLNEEEAKETRCCGPEGCGRINMSGDMARYCIGSDCMAWRWIGWSGPCVIPPGATVEWRPQYTPYKMSDDQERFGYCGLAGDPQ